MSFFGKILKVVAPIAGTAIGGLIGGPVGAKIGGSLGSLAGGALGGGGGGGSQQNAANNAVNLQSQIAAEQWQRYKDVYAPLESQYVKEAQNFGSDANYARAAGDASATVSQQFGKARDRLGRTPGLDPSSAAFQAGMTGLDLAQAASDATAQNAARTNVRDTAFARQGTALSMGKGLDGAAASGLGSAASNQLQLARYNQGQATNEAAGLGQFAGQILNTPGLQDAISSGVKKIGGLFTGGGDSGGFMPKSGFLQYDKQGL